MLWQGRVGDRPVCDVAVTDENGHRHTWRVARARPETAEERKAAAREVEPMLRKVRSKCRADKQKALRPYDRSGPNARAKAVEYALWLAARDGVDVPPEVTWTRPAEPWEKGEGLYGSRITESTWKVEFAWCYHEKANGSTIVASHVCFGDVTIDIPHVGYDPTVMPEDEGAHACRQAPPVFELQMGA